MDLHSHGASGAFFSTQDDTDDRASGEVKLAGVVGRVNDAPEWQFRLAACGVFKERLSQSALYAGATQVGDDEARVVYDWLVKKGMTFHLGTD